MDERVTLPELVECWIDDLAIDHAPQTIKRYRSVLHGFRTWYEHQEQEPLMVANLTPIALVGYRNALQKTAATSTVNTHLAALRTWCAWLVTHRHLTASPAERLKFVKRTEPNAPQALTGKQVHALLQAAQHTRYPARDYAVIQLLLQTGLRIGECAALQWDDIRFGEKRGQVVVRAGKGNKARVVPLNTSARQALAEYFAPRLGSEATLRAVAGVWPQQGSPLSLQPLWLSQKRGALSISALERMIAEVVKACTGRQLLPPSTTAHALRHTFATAYLVAHPGDLVGLAQLLGHSSLDATKIYVQPTGEEMARRIEQVDLNAYG